MKTSQSFTEPSQEQWDEVDRLEHRYFEKFGVRPKRPEFITHEQPTMASVGKYLGDLREMLGKDRSSKRHFTPREQEVNLTLDRMRVWADLHHQVHGPSPILTAPEDVEAGIKKLKEELLTRAYSSPRHSREQYTIFGPDGSVKVLMIPEDTPDEEKAFRIKQAYNSLVEQAQQRTLRHSLFDGPMRDCESAAVALGASLAEKRTQEREAKRHHDHLVDEIKFLAELRSGPTFIKSVIGFSGPWETNASINELESAVRLSREYVKKQKADSAKSAGRELRNTINADLAFLSNLLKHPLVWDPDAPLYLNRVKLARAREAVRRQRQEAEEPKSTSQLSFFAILDGKTVDITDEFHAWQESVRPSVEELVKAAEDVAGGKLTKCPHCGSEKTKRVSKDGEFIVIFGCEGCDKSFFKNREGSTDV